MSALLEETQISTRRWTVEEYFGLTEKGVIGPEERTELIRGEICTIPPIGPWHSGTVSRSNRSLNEIVGSEAIISPQNPIVLGNDSAPEPDFTLLRNRDDFYTDSHPTAEDVILAIEISDSSYLYDKNVKAPLYAEHGIPEYWLVHRSRSEVTVFSELKNGTYESEKVFRSPASLPITELDLEIPVASFGI